MNSSELAREVRREAISVPGASEDKRAAFEDMRIGAKIALRYAAENPSTLGSFVYVTDLDRLADEISMEKY